MAAILMTCQPYASGLEVSVGWEAVPDKIHRHVNAAFIASVVPEPAAVLRRAIGIWSFVVVSIVSGKQHSIVQSYGIMDSSGVTSHRQAIVAFFVPDNEYAHFCRVYHGVRLGSEDKQGSVVTVLRHRVQQVVAQPEVTDGVVESDFKLRPRTIEEIGPEDILLYQQRHAAGCNANSLVTRFRFICSRS